MMITYIGTYNNYCEMPNIATQYTAVCILTEEKFVDATLVPSLVG